MKKIILSVGFASTVLFSGLFLGDIVHADEWKANSVEQINIVEGQKEYTIKRGDTLWAISQKTNIGIQKLASLNSIKNINLIYTGNKLVFDGNVVTVKDASGEVKKSVSVTNEEKIDSSKKIGMDVSTSITSTQENTSQTADSNSTSSSYSDVSSDTGTTDSSIDNSSSTTSLSDSTDGSNDSSTSSTDTPTPTSIEGYISQSPTSKKTDQIVAVVASNSNSKVYFLNKGNDGAWNRVFETNGFVGSQGIGQASESTSRTPKGSYALSFAFGTGANVGTQLEYRQITQNSYWISNVNDSQYNTWQERQSSSGIDEHLIDYPVQYKYAMVLDYNNGVGGGSAFFLHCSNGQATAGCIAIPETDMLTLMKTIHSGAHIINVNSESELANY